ncbi:hypothetical protein [Methanosarcina horonobensis]|uniref:hypothetical protein n=1 Tax=Methanosarcina horonobensis TaxID=418008 RepID=UPI000B291C86|nr:hypothetical protein [Methanosarcina horonobensis]
MIAEKKGAIAVSPQYLGQAALEYWDNAESVFLQGVDPAAEESVIRVYFFLSSAGESRK